MLKIVSGLFDVIDVVLVGLDLSQCIIWVHVGARV